MELIKKFLKQAVSSFGLDIVRYSPIPLEQARAINSQQKGASFLKMLTYQQIDLVLDVGANTGQFGSYLFEIGYSGKVVSFEPLSSAYEQLKLTSQSYPQWKITPRCAVGDREGEVEINIAQNSESSSILPMLQAHLDAAPRSTYIQTEKVKVVKLDDIARKDVESAQATLLKIDTQGYEEKVLAGALEIMPKLRGLHVELSLVPLYDGQDSFENMLNKIENLGFSLYSIYPGFSDYRTGRLLQVMGTFFRD